MRSTLFLMISPSVLRHLDHSVLPPVVSRNAPSSAYCCFCILFSRAFPESGSVILSELFGSRVRVFFPFRNPNLPWLSPAGPYFRLLC